MSAGCPRFAVTGPPGCGKTTALTRVVATLARHGAPCGGLLQPVVLRSGCRVGYDLLAFGSGPDLVRPADVARVARQDGGRSKRPLVRFGSDGVVFDRAGFAEAAAAVRHARHAGELLIVDELGWWEAQGGGHMPALTARSPAGDAAPAWFLGVRQSALDRVSTLLGGFRRVLRLPEERRVLSELVDGLAMTIGGAPRTSPGEGTCTVRP